MKKRRKQIVIFVLLVAVFFFLRFSGAVDYITFENLKRHRDALHAYVRDNYLRAALVYVGLYISTAFIVPGALVLTLAGGFLFGVVMGTIYTNIGGTAGALLAFLLARHLAGNWMQDKYRIPLKKFNEEMKKNGYLYLIALRVVPVFPFFLVNYLAGFTKVRLRTFAWTTLAGMLPGSVAYTFAGQQFRSVNSPGDLLSKEIFIALAPLAIFSLVPVIVKYMRRARN